MIAYLAVSIALLLCTTAIAVALMVRSAAHAPSCCLWICDGCGRAVRADADRRGVLTLQRIRAAHDCPARADIATEVEAFLAHQPPP